MDDLVGLAVAFGLVLLNAFFVAAEFSLVSVRRSRIATLVEDGNATAAVVMKAIRDQDRFIAATQLGITIASLGLGWVGEPALGHLIEPVLEPILHPFLPEGAESAANALAIGGIISFTLITFMHVVIGELMPKSIALQFPERTALWVARPTALAVAVFRWPIRLLNGTGNFFLRLLGINPASGHELVHSVEELRLLIRSSAESGIFEEKQQEMVEAVFEMEEIRARQLMTPRTEIVGFQADTPLSEVIAAVVDEENALSKFPVFEADLDHVIGILHIQDLLRVICTDDLDTSLRDLARPPLEVAESVTIGDLLHRFRQARQHLAILLDEYGGTAGLITLEDLLEEIVGDVQDPFETPGEADIRPQGDGTVLINGLTPIDEVNDTLGLGLVCQKYETIAGFVLERLDRLADVGDEVDAGLATLRVESLDGLRIAEVRLVVKHGEAAAAGEITEPGADEAAR